MLPFTFLCSEFWVLGSVFVFVFRSRVQGSVPQLEHEPGTLNPEPERLCQFEGFSFGSLNATSSLEYPPPPIATTMYCLPLYM